MKIMEWNQIFFTKIFQLFIFGGFVYFHVTRTVGKIEYKTHFSEDIFSIFAIVF